MARSVVEVAGALVGRRSRVTRLWATASRSSACSAHTPDAGARVPQSAVVAAEHAAVGDQQPPACRRERPGVGAEGQPGRSIGCADPVAGLPGPVVDDDDGGVVRQRIGDVAGRRGRCGVDGAVGRDLVHDPAARDIGDDDDPGVRHRGDDPHPVGSERRRHDAAPAGADRVEHDAPPGVPDRSVLSLPVVAVPVPSGVNVAPVTAPAVGSASPPSARSRSTASMASSMPHCGSIPVAASAAAASSRPSARRACRRAVSRCRSTKVVSTPAITRRRRARRGPPGDVVSAVRPWPCRPRFAACSTGSEAPRARLRDLDRRLTGLHVAVERQQALERVTAADPAVPGRAVRRRGAAPRRSRQVLRGRRRASPAHAAPRARARCR